MQFILDYLSRMYRKISPRDIKKLLHHMIKMMRVQNKYADIDSEVISGILRQTLPVFRHIIIRIENNQVLNLILQLLDFLLQHCGQDGQQVRIYLSASYNPKVNLQRVVYFAIDFATLFDLLKF